MPFEISSADFVPGGVFTANTVLGSFNVPFSTFSGDQDGSTILTNVPDYKTSYNGIDISARKRMSNNFLVNASATIQRQKANYDGANATAFYIGDGGLTGTVFPFDPSNLGFLDGEPYAFAPGGSGKSGVYPYSEWQFKLSGVYQFPWDVAVGAFARYQQGYPYVLFASFTDDTLAGALGTDTSLILLEPFGSRRFENIFTLDLQFEKGFDLSNYGRLSFMANLFLTLQTQIR